MKIGIIGDLHCKLGDTLHPKLSEALGRYDAVIDLGDQCEVQIYGIDAWRSEMGRQTIHSIASSVKQMIVISKNHWGFTRWAQELYEPYPHVTVLDEYEFTVNGRTYWFRHGSEYSEWKLMQPAANLTTLIMNHNPFIRRLWHRWLTYWGYLSPDPPQDIEMGQKIIDSGIWRNAFGTRGIKGVWNKALKDVEKRIDTTLFIAHTHNYCYRKGKNGNEIYNIRPRQLVDLRV